MKLNDISELYELICQGTKGVVGRKSSIQLRKAGLSSFISGKGFKKLAFDTRRIDQETEYNPRRGLQNYSRSEAFISQALSDKLHNLSKLRNVLGELKQIYGREHEWQDSNARVLLSTLDKGLRTVQQDGDYAESQQSVGSLDYIEELLHVRYRLNHDNLKSMAASELKLVILSKDEELTRKDINHDVEITKGDVGKQSYDTLMEKLFGGVRATRDNPEVERTVTITIKDKFVETE